MCLWVRGFGDWHTIAVLGIPAVIALCFALPVGRTFIGEHEDRAGGWLMVVLAALAWSCGDWLRSCVLTGLPLI